MIGRNLYVAGGSDSNAVFNKKLLVYKTSARFDQRNFASGFESEWKPFPNPDLELPALEFHSCVSTDTSLFIFGGTH